MLRARFTDLVGCTVPIRQAPIEARPHLAAAVSEAGGLGMMAVYGYPPAVIAGILDTVRQLTTRPVGANLVMRFQEPDEAHECVATAASRVQVVDFFFTDPDPTLVETVRQQGALVSWQNASYAGGRDADSKAQCRHIRFLVMSLNRQGQYPTPVTQ